MIRFFLLLSVSSLSLHAVAQPASYSFRRLTTAEGLCDDIVRSLTEDKYGFLWVGTVNGVTVYNGYSCRTIETGRASGARSGNVTALCRDSAGNVWAALAEKLYRYDYGAARFTPAHAAAALSVNKMYALSKESLCLLTGKGLQLFNTATGTVQSPAGDAVTQALLRCNVADVCGDGQTLYLATDTGVVVYEPLQQKARLLSANAALRHMAKIVKNGNEVWCSSLSTLYRLDGPNAVAYPVTALGSSAPDNHISDLLSDKDGRLWAGTTRTGLCLFDKKAFRFVSFRNDPMQPQSLSANFARNLFQSSDGTVWIGTEGYGINYFNPERNVFRVLLPSANQTPTLPDAWCRAVSEDADGKWWLATANGAAVYDPQTETYKVFRNEGGKKRLYGNSVRSVLCASDGTVWIGTADGLNRYHPQTGRMDFPGKKEGLPLSFFWNLAEDRQHRIWAVCRNGIYTFNPAGKTFDNNDRNVLQPYRRSKASCVFIDRNNNVWIGLNGGGLLRYNEKENTVKNWTAADGDTAALVNNFITSIAQDKGGHIWLTTAGGLCVYDEEKASFRQYTTADGLATGKLSSLLIDDADRLWMGSSKGLCLMDAQRRRVKVFGPEDGLSTATFNDQSAGRLRNGYFVYPTFRGFLYFKPSDYVKEEQALPVYLESFRVYNQPLSLGTNPEAVSAIRLKWNQAFFSFTVAAPDFGRTARTVYAYWLEGFDKARIYTGERTRNYTNVPGGDYTLHVKAADGPETTIAVHIGTVFYKQWWFVSLAAVLFLAAGYALYRNRLRQQHRVMALQAKATALEKEKTLALYESLKQQLNPHFLFNSLSSLSGLIQKDQSKATVFLERLSKIYRYILKSGQSETVRVSEDLKLAETYVKLQQTRFGSGLQLAVALDEEALNKKIAPVTLQNLIENAIKHNVIDAETPLMITIGATDGFLTVQNNLQKKSFVEGSNKQGLQHMKTLYRYLTGKTVAVEEAAETFTVKIPFV